MWHNDDLRKNQVARRVLDGEHTWLEQGIVSPVESAANALSRMREEAKAA
jgi:hypothetical protein